MTSDLALPTPTLDAKPSDTSWLKWTNHRVLFCITLVVGMIILCQFQFWKLPAKGDRANWDYFAQVIARGGAPYRDVVNIKSPLSAYIGAAAIIATRPFGIREIYATRVTFVLLAALTAGFTFLVANLYFNSSRIGLLAALILLGVYQFARLNSDGIQPKTPMILFGLVALWAVIKDRPFLAGVFGMLSALSWQPGLLFVGAAGLAFSKYLTSWRDMKVVRLLAGAFLPLAIFLSYLWAAGALKDFYIWCIHFPFSVYAPRDKQTFQMFLDRLSLVLEESYEQERLYFYLAGIGAAAIILREIISAAKQGSAYFLNRAPRHQVVIASLVYLLFCRIDMQGEQDLIPLLPFVAIFASVLLIWLLDLTTKLFARAYTKLNNASVERIGFAALLMLVFFLSVADAFTFKAPRKTLKAQDADVTEIMSHLGPGDQIFVHGRTEMLALSGLTNSRKYTNLDHGKDNYLDQVEPGGFDGWFEQLKSDRPKVVMISRIDNVDRKKDLLRWVKEDYERIKGRVFTYYLRKEQ
jgi:hypothetical protein